MKKPVYTFVRYYRKPTPQCNWCPRYAAVYLGKDLVEERLNSYSIKYVKDQATKAYDDASNVVHDYRKALDWDRILELGEVELTVREFKQYEKRFKIRLEELCK